MKMKRFVSFVLAFALVLSLVPVAFAEEPVDGLLNFKKIAEYSDGQFSDVSDNEWYAEGVKSAFELGLMKGRSEDQFGTDGPLTLAETIVLAARIRSTYYNDGVEFLQGDPWYQVYVDYALEKKIIYNPYDSYTNNVSRKDFAYILSRALPREALVSINEIEDGSIPDVPTNEFYKDAVYTFYRAGVLTGNDSAGTFTPNAPIDRVAVAAIVSRMVNPSLRKELTLTAEKIPVFAANGSMMMVTRGEAAAMASSGWSESYNPPELLQGSKFKYGQGIVYLESKGETDSDLLKKNTSIKTLYIKRGTTKVSSYSFDGCTSLNRVEIPDTTTEIGSYAFDDCAITRIGIPSQVTKIDSYAFGSLSSYSKNANKNCTIYGVPGYAAETFAKENKLKFVSATQVFYPDGRSMMVSPQERPAYLANGWSDKPVMTVYSETGESKVILASEEAKWKEEGWGTLDVMQKTMYMMDGRSKTVFLAEVENSKKEGWYLYVDYVSLKADQLVKSKGYEAAVNYIGEEILSDRATLIDAILLASKSFDVQEAWSKSIKSPVAILGYTMSSNSIGVPEVNIKFRNLTDKKISSIEFDFICIDAYGKPTSDYSYNSNGKFNAVMENNTLSAYSVATFTWTLYSNERTKSIKNITFRKAAASDGSVWNGTYWKS